MNYEQTLDHLYSQLPMFSRIGAAAYKEDLHNTIAICKALDNPQHKFKSIHIAGTNGKGSTSHMLAAILQQAGYKTGLYTSPHLKDFRERIKINGEFISKEFIVDFVERTKALSESIQPSFFELTVAMAFEYFALEKVDIAIIETGLGGRLDSTNVITPILSVITNIGYDHTNILGNTLEKIAFEKAGIIKKNIPVVIGEYVDETKPVFLKKAEEEKAPIYFAQDKFNTSDLQFKLELLSLSVEDSNNRNKEIFALDLTGAYQVNNLLTVLSAEEILLQQGFIISSEAEKFALANVKKLTGLHGRWEVIQDKPIIILDVGHNENGVRQIVSQSANYILQHTDAQLHFVMGFVKDKDVDAVLQLFPKEANYYFTHSHIPRALPAEELQQKAAIYRLQGDRFENVNDALKAAKQKANEKDLIVVCGSVFLVGEVNN
ncbi:bifunctional folylpolyglutamate synthase/dihydrofolate synthase [Ferruginibacter albus]|uniref:bifunctional folylpolyglutamate synthase/dihydrofolate synthase n=1 Tax=Ferruginibacter albus TaxID=2875540 RepID=UPI001CC55F1C|nr:folylpolyglutamate synthase/dihydrofolate synthase family protein [Ferruginibacter albus]UAY52927.1 bifunctional folylpolyglutamate synthase/dihydrofolate synthase [Ferruginibacter albus]